MLNKYVELHAAILSQVMKKSLWIRDTAYKGTKGSQVGLN